MSLVFFCQSEDGIRDAHECIEFRRVFYRAARRERAPAPHWYDRDHHHRLGGGGRARLPRHHRGDNEGGAGRGSWYSRVLLREPRRLRLRAPLALLGVEPRDPAALSHRIAAAPRE